MKSEQRFQTKRLDHLGIFHESDCWSEQPHSELRCSRIQALVLNALDFTSQARYLMPQYLHNKSRFIF